MRLAVTGAGGFLGTHLVGRLRERFPSAEVFGIVRRSPTHPVAGVAYTDRLENSDVTFHLAGGGSVAASLLDPRADLLLNASSTIDVLEQIRVKGTGRLVLASSAAVYGTANGSVPEEHPPAPTSPYGVSKLASELYVHAYERLHGLRASVARIGNAYGPGQRQLAIYDLAARALTEPPPLRLHGTGEEVRDFVHASDVVEALILIAFTGREGWTYNVASGRHVSIREVAALVAAAAEFGPDAVTTDGAGELGKPNMFCPSIDRLTGIGFEPSVSLERGILETVRWVRSER